MSEAFKAVNNSISIVAKLLVGRPEFDFRNGYGRDFFVISTTPRSDLRPTLPPIQWIPVFSPGDKAAGA
jgi:hypothetical protein